MLVSIVIAIFIGFVPDSHCHDRPVIGVLVQEITKVFELLYPNKYETFIAASYVKWIEAGGARVVPIWIGKDQNYYKTILSKVNGVLLPGGSVDKHKRGGYAEAADLIVEHAIELNLRGEVFPVFGIGLGMDLLLSMSNDKRDTRTVCQLDSVAAPLVFSKNGERRYGSTEITQDFHLCRHKQNCVVQINIGSHPEIDDNPSRCRTEHEEMLHR